MQSRCKPPRFHEQDWSRFDFSRWHLDGITLDAAAAALAGLSEQLFNSAEWREHFQATLPALEREALASFESRALELRGQKKAVAEEFDKRIAEAQERSNEFRKSVEAAAAPPVIQPAPNTFHVAVKVTGHDPSLGLPGLLVKIAHPSDPTRVLAQEVTDENGNAILTVPEEVAREVDKSDTDIEVLDPTGKSLLKAPGAVCVRVNQVETKVLSSKESREVASLKEAALATRAERDLRVRMLDERMQTLKQEHEERQRDLDCKLQDTEAMIADFESKDEVVRIVEAAVRAATPGQSSAAPAPAPAPAAQPKEAGPQAKAPPQRTKGAARARKEAPPPKETPPPPKRGRKKKK